MKLEKGITIAGFCCPGFAWEIFDIDGKGWVYSECDNPQCENLSVFAPELGDVDALKEKLAQR